MSSVTLNASDLDRVTSALKRLMSGPVEVERSEDQPIVLPSIVSEFMLWLWHEIDTSKGALYIGGDPEGEGDIGEAVYLEAWIESRMGFRPADEAKVRTLCTLDPSKDPEAKAAIRGGKLVQEMRIAYRDEDGLEYAFTIKGPDLRLTAVKLPPILGDGDDDIMTLIESRMELLERVDRVVARLFVRFCTERLEFKDKRQALASWLAEDFGED